jgi:uncharacterized phage protein (TIGR02220 family)
MARPIKDGYEYYPKDTDLFSDRKIKRLIRSFGGDGYMIYDFILCDIYRDKGYFIEWNKDYCFDIGHEFNLSEVRVSEIVSHCVNVDLFDLLQFEKGILTSRGIQNRWQVMNRTAKRTDKNIQEKYQIKIVNSEETIINSEETIVNSEETPIKSGKSTQSKVKESKVNIISITEIIDHLNLRSGKNFRNSTKQTQNVIQARLNEGFTIEQFKSVIDIKSSKWKNDPKMEDYLRPETLFGNKFESYLNEKPTNGHATKEIEPAKGLSR